MNKEERLQWILKWEAEEARRAEGKEERIAAAKKKGVAFCYRCGRENPEMCPTCNKYLDTYNIVQHGSVSNFSTPLWTPTEPICRGCGGYCYECSS